jgi:3-methyl-2-oxobutanoate hydroxymethyltransferase
MARARPTIADIRALKGKRQLCKLRVTTLEEAEAAEQAGIDMLSVTPELICDRRFREAAPSVFAIPGLDYFDVGTADDFVRWSFAMLKAGADAVYCSASLDTVKRLAQESVPVIGHVGLIPSKRSWTGGFRAVGKTADSALEIYRDTKALEAAGAFGAEIEVVPEAVAAEVSRRTALIMIGMGAGKGCDAQYLFAEDVLGTNRGHYPRHSKKYRDFAAQLDRMQAERVAAFTEFAGDVASGDYPATEHSLGIDAEELQKFLAGLDDS